MRSAIVFGLVFILCMPEVMGMLIRKSRAFKINNAQRVPFKRDIFDSKDEVLLPPAMNTYLLSRLLNTAGNGGISVRDIADQLKQNKLTTVDLVNAFLDGNGDRLGDKGLVMSYRRR